jgi:hypothetical protein
MTDSVLHGQARARALPAEPAGTGIRHLGDFTTNPRVLFICAVAVVVGSGGVIAGLALLKLIALVTNLVFSASSAWPRRPSAPARSPPGPSPFPSSAR